MKLKALAIFLVILLVSTVIITEREMGSNKQIELMQIITADGETFDLTSNSKKGNWVLEASGFGMPDIDYITQQGPFQHGVSVRDYRLKPRMVQLLLRQQACDRDEYWALRTALLNALRPNRDPITLSGAWAIRSQYLYDDEEFIYSLCEFNNELYAGTQLGGKLFKWDGSSQWILMADTLDAQMFIYDLVVYDDGGGTDELYGSTWNGGRLFKWDGVDSWEQVCAQAGGTEAGVICLATFDDGLAGDEKIFGGTDTNGQLYYYDVGGGAWALSCAQLGAETVIWDLCVFDDGGGDDLYGSTHPNGMLYRYNPAGPAWVQVCAQLGAETSVRSLCVYNDELYGGTCPNGKLYKYDVTGGQWEEVADTGPSGETCISKLVVYHGQLYGMGYNTGDLYRFNGSDAWELACSDQLSQGIRYNGIVFNNRLFAGTGNGAYLYEYIRRSGDSGLPSATLRRVLSDGSIRDLDVLIDKGPEFTTNKRGWDEFSFQEVIRLWAPDPILYDPVAIDGPPTGIDVPDDTVGYILDENGNYVLQEDGTSLIELEGVTGFSGAVYACWDINYYGTWGTHPTFVITGPLSNPIIRNEKTDEYIELDYDIPSDRTVTIDLTPGNQRVEDDLGTNLIGIVTPESNLQSFHIAPGPEVEDGLNTICLIGSDADAETAFAFTYYNRYIGI